MLQAQRTVLAAGSARPVLPAGRPLLCRRAGRSLRHTVSAVEQKQEDKQKAPSSPPPPNKPNKPSGGDDAKLEAVTAELKKAGLDPAKARKLLQAWDKIGVKDSDQLKQLLIKRAVQPLTSVLLQSLFDGVACFGGFFLAYLASNSGDMPFRFVVELLGNAAGLYYFVNVLLQLGTAGAILYSTWRYGTSSVEVLAAVQNLAGPSSGVPLIDKAQAAVNTFKVLQTLEAVAALLQDKYGDNAQAPDGGSSTKDSLRNLSALLTLARAKELGFNPDEYGLSEKQAANIAVAFSVYDLNDNGKLDTPEIGNLCSSLGWSLNDAELAEAVKTLDKDKNGSIDFKEFVQWWMMKSPQKVNM